MALTTDIGHSFLGPYFGDPIGNRAAYEAHSPLAFAHTVHVPVLLLHGGGGGARVPTFQSELLFNALKDGGRTCRRCANPVRPTGSAVPWAPTPRSTCSPG